MKTKWRILICLISMLAGILFVVIHQDIIIINYPRDVIQRNTSFKATKKNIQLIYWHQDKWKTENQELVWHNDITKNIYYLVNSLLTLMHEENTVYKKVLLQSVLISTAGHEAYLSFDRAPFSKQQITFDKWMFIESILKTIKHNKIPIQQIQFLVHHQPLHDLHIDFSKVWNIHGFLD